MSLDPAFSACYARPAEAAQHIESILRTLAGTTAGTPLPDDILRATRTGIAYKLSGVIEAYTQADIIAAMTTVLIDAGAPKNIIHADVACLALGIIALLHRDDETVRNRNRLPCGRRRTNATFPSTLGP